MSNGTRKKVVDFKKLLINEEDNIIISKKTLKPNYSNQNSSHKKDKNSKINQRQRENQSKAPEKPTSKKQKTKNCKKKEQLSLAEFNNKLNEYKEELAFLKKKRNADINIEKIINFQKNSQNKANSALINYSNNNDSKNKNNNPKNKKSQNLKDINNNSSNSKNINDVNIEINKNNTKTEVDTENSTLIIDFYKLYYHLFESNRLDNSKPYKFVDYLITGDNLLFNLKKDKIRFEEIKKGITVKSKNNSLINEQLLNKSIYEYLRCDFSNSFMKKMAEKINESMMNRYSSKKKERNSLENSISIEKKDKFTYSNFLSDKLKDNANKSCLSFTNDTDYFKSLIYVCNKYSKYIGKKEIPEKILIESLEKNKKILEDFKHSKEDGEMAKKIEMGYLKNLLHNKSIRKYIAKKMRSFNCDKLENNEILNSLDINIFYKIMNIILKNKSDDDIDKLYKLFEENIPLKDNNKIDKNHLKNFIIIFKFFLELSLTNKLNNDINLCNNMNEKNGFNNISLLREIYENINKNQLINKQALNEPENNSNSNNGLKSKGRNRIKIKKIKENKNIKKEEKDSENKNINNNSINSLNNNNDANGNIISNSIENNSHINNNETKPKKRNTKNSKIIPFKIPYSLNNNTNKLTNGLFEINNKSEINTTKNSNQIKIDEINKNNVNEKTHFETYNEFHKESIENLKEKENNKSKRRRKRNTEENKENTHNTKNDFKDIKINEDSENHLLNNCMTFYTINQTAKKELNLGKYILNRLSSGQDIFKLIIEKPKIKRNKEKEQSENSNSKEKDKENEKDIEIEKEEEKDNNKSKEKKRRKKKRNKIKDGDIKTKQEEKETKNEKFEESKEKCGEDKNIENKKEKYGDKKEKEIIKNKEEKEIINNKEIKNNKKDIETRENSSRSIEKNEPLINSNMNLKSNIIFHKSEKERNIDIIHFNNCMMQEGEQIKEITRNDLKHSPNICVKISQKTLKYPSYKTLGMEMKDINKKNNELIFNISNYNTKYFFSINKNNSNYETKAKMRKKKKDSFNNKNIQIDRQSVEIKGGNFILNNKRDNQDEDIIKIKDYFNAI